MVFGRSEEWKLDHGIRYPEEVLKNWTRIFCFNILIHDCGSVSSSSSHLLFMVKVVSVVSIHVSTFCPRKWAAVLLPMSRFSPSFSDHSRTTKYSGRMAMDTCSIWHQRSERGQNSREWFWHFASSLVALSLISSSSFVRKIHLFLSPKF